MRTTRSSGPIRPICAPSRPRNIEDATARSLELARSHRRARRPAPAQARRDLFDARVTAVVAGQRAVLDVVERPTGGGSAGIAVDVSELEAVRDRSAAADGRASAHPRPIADRRGDLRRRAESHLQQRGLPATLEPRPGLPRLAALRTARCSIVCGPRANCPSRRISAPGRPISCPAITRSNPQRDLVAPAGPAHPARRHQPEPEGRRHLSVRRRQRALPARIAGHGAHARPERNARHA